MSGSLTIGIDVGATKLAASVVGADGSVLARRRWPERVTDYAAALDAMVALVDDLEREAASTGATARAVGVAVAAFLDAERTHIAHAANLDWHDLALQADLEDRLALPIRIVNDADAAAWGEHAYGAGAGESSFVLITLGTGVGAGIVIGGELVTGAHGLGGEIGHLQVVVDGRRCACGGRGCLEQYASGTALRAAAQSGARTHPDAAQCLLALAGNDVDSIDGPQILAAARRGDTVARGAFEQIGGWLGIGIAQIVAVLDPGAVLIGGGLAAAGELILTPARNSYARHRAIPALRRDAPVALAALGADAGMIGAAALARGRFPTAGAPEAPQARGYTGLPPSGIV